MKSLSVKPVWRAGWQKGDPNAELLDSQVYWERDSASLFLESAPSCVKNDAGSTLCESGLEPQSQAGQVTVGVIGSLCARPRAEGTLRVTPSDLHICPLQQVHVLSLFTRYCNSRIH